MKHFQISVFEERFAFVQGKRTIADSGIIGAVMPFCEDPAGDLKRYLEVMATNISIQSQIDEIQRFMQLHQSIINFMLEVREFVLRYDDLGEGELLILEDGVYTLPDIEEWVITQDELTVFDNRMADAIINLFYKVADNLKLMNNAVRDYNDLNYEDAEELAQFARVQKNILNLLHEIREFVLRHNIKDTDFVELSETAE